jgi:multidrug efflux pump subunit AcrA (membrane-fusion protein)
MGVKVAFQSDEPTDALVANAILVPKAALQSSADGRGVVWLVRFAASSTEGELERKAVGLGPARGEEQVVTAGVSPGDTLVLNPPSDLAEGKPVKVEKQ